MSLNSPATRVPDRACPVTVQITSVRPLDRRYEVQRACGHLQLWIGSESDAPRVGEYTACVTCACASGQADDDDDLELVDVNGAGSYAWLRKEKSA